MREPMGHEGLRSIARYVRRIGSLVAGTAALLALADPADAHPHVWVTMQSEIVYAEDGTITEVRHRWTFDEMFSTFAVQGLDKRKKGEFSREDLAGLAQVNVESLQEYRYFTFVRSSSKRVLLQKPTNYWLDYNDGLLTLNFTLPLKTSVSAQTLSLEFYDPVGFVDFTLSERNAIKLIGAPAACKLNIRKPPAGPSTSTLGEAFFNSLTASSNWGEQFANKITIQC